MEYVRKLLQETDYLKRMKELETLEIERRFCRHGLEHALDVARIAWIKVLEEHRTFDKEEVYLTALLHDIGRITEYQEGISHQEAGMKIAEELLAQIGYPKEKQFHLVEAIGRHREKDEIKDDFMGVIKKADVSSRNCFFCSASEKCKWNTQRKNMTIVW